MTEINQLNLLITKVKQHREKNNTMMGNMNMGNNMGNMNMGSMNMGNNMGNMNMGNNMGNSFDSFDSMNNNNPMMGSIMGMNSGIMMNNNMNMMNNINNMNMNLMGMMDSNQNNASLSNVAQLANPLENSQNTATVVLPFYELSVIFIKNGDRTTIICKSNEKISQIISKYRIKAEDNNENLKFIFNAKVLNKNSTVSESGLVNGSVIYVVLSV